MAYIKFEARHFGDDLWLRLSPAAFTVHAWALSWTNEQNTDGKITKDRAHRLVCPVDPAELPSAWAELVEAGKWRAVGDYYECPTFTAHGLPSEEQNSTRDKWATDKRRQRLHRVGNHSLCTPRSCAAARVSTGGHVDTSTEDMSTCPPRTLVDMSTLSQVDKWTTRPDPTRPDPTRPEGEGSGSGADPAGSAGATPAGPESAGAGRLVVRMHRYPDECAELRCRLPRDNRWHYRPDEKTAANNSDEQETQPPETTEIQELKSAATGGGGLSIG